MTKSIEDMHDHIDTACIRQPATLMIFRTALQCFGRRMGRLWRWWRRWFRDWWGTPEDKGTKIKPFAIDFITGICLPILIPGPRPPSPLDQRNLLANADQVVIHWVPVIWSNFGHFSVIWSSEIWSFRLYSQFLPG